MILEKEYQKRLKSLSLEFVRKKFINNELGHIFGDKNAWKDMLEPREKEVYKRGVEKSIIYMLAFVFVFNYAYGTHLENLKHDYFTHLQRPTWYIWTIAGMFFLFSTVYLGDAIHQIRVGFRHVKKPKFYKMAADHYMEMERPASTVMAEYFRMKRGAYEDDMFNRLAFIKKERKKSMFKKNDSRSRKKHETFHDDDIAGRLVLAKNASKDLDVIIAVLDKHKSIPHTVEAKMKYKELKKGKAV